MASADEQSNSKKSDSPEFDGRIFLVDGKEFPVESEVLNLIIEWSQYFRALLTSDFKEANLKKIEIKEVSATDFENFVLLHRCKAAADKSLDENSVREEAVKFTRVMTGSNVGALLLLCDRFMAPNSFTMLNKMLESFAKTPITLKKVDLIAILQVAFQLNNEDLKKFSVFLMKKVGLVTHPAADMMKGDNFPLRWMISLRDENIFFLNNEARVNSLDLEITRYIREQVPGVQDIINL